MNDLGVIRTSCWDISGLLFLPYTHISDVHRNHYWTGVRIVQDARGHGMLTPMHANPFNHNDHLEHGNILWIQAFNMLHGFAETEAALQSIVLIVGGFHVIMAIVSAQILQKRGKDVVLPSLKVGSPDIMQTFLSDLESEWPLYIL